MTDEEIIIKSGSLASALNARLIETGMTKSQVVRRLEGQLSPRSVYYAFSESSVCRMRTMMLVADELGLELRLVPKPQTHHDIKD